MQNNLVWKTNFALYLSKFSEYPFFSQNFGNCRMTWDLHGDNPDHAG